MHNQVSTEIVVIGSGAGGATTAYELSKAGFQVLLLEEGKRHPLSDYGADSATAMQRLYRNRGMTPIQGKVPIGFIEGCCVGGTTEINSGLWYRLPAETAAKWKQFYKLKDFEFDELATHFDWAEEQLHVSLRKRDWPKSSLVFKQGADKLGWSAQEIPRAANLCVDTNKCASGCPKGAKQGLSLNLIPTAESNGAIVISSCKVRKLLREGSKITGVLAEITEVDGRIQPINVSAKHVFVCGGATQTPLILRRSGIKHCIGDTFIVHPMLKVAALFDQELNAQNNVLPFVHVQEFQPTITLAGAYFTPGHLGVILGENWSNNHAVMHNYKHMSTYSVTASGTGKGSIREPLLGKSSPTLRYELSKEDLHNLSDGLAKLALLLLAAGAKEVYPCVSGLPKITSTHEASRWAKELLPRAGLALTTVHAFSSCPMGEVRESCAVDSFGKVFDLVNLYINDASMLPDCPNVNPQGTIMAIARRNVRRFIDRLL